MSETVTQQSDRFEVTTDAGPAGFTQFVDHDDQRVYFHTEIDPAFGGRGLAGILVRQALDATRTDGLSVVPVCPYVKKYVGEHADWNDIVVPVTPEALRAIPRG